MKHFCNSGSFFILFITMLLLVACGGGDGGGGDSKIPVVTLTSPNGGEEVVGTYSIIWNNKESFPSTVLLEISNDSGSDWRTIAEKVPDTGSYVWDSYDGNPYGRQDGSQYRIRITAKDVAGNTGAPAESGDFTIDNIPKISGVGRYKDVNTNGIADAGDTLTISFDRPVTLNSSQASDFNLPVSGDSLGEGASAASAPANANDVIITLGTQPRFNTRGDFSADITSANSPSSIDVSKTIGEGTIVGSVIPPGLSVAVSAAASTPVDLLSTLSVERDTFGDQNTTAMAVGDLNRDGYPDVVTTVGGTSPSLVYYNNRSGKYLDSTVDGLKVSLLNDAISNDVVVADLNKDGWLDIVVVNGFHLSAMIGADQANEVWLNNGTGGFTTPVTFGSLRTYAVAVGDIDKDGDDDVIAGNRNGAATQVWQNNGGNLVLVQSFGNFETLALELVDVDGDDDLDIIEGAFDGAGVHIWTNTSGVFSVGPVLGSSNVGALTVGDVDGDGDQDIIAGNRTDSITGATNDAWQNDGAGNFTLITQTFELLATTDVNLVDFDSDGDLDIIEAAANSVPDSVTYTNDGTGTFTKSLFSFAGVGDQTIKIVAADVENDGDVDIIAGNTNNNRIWNASVSGVRGVLSLNSAGSLSGGDTRSVALGDLDMDGDLDIVTANHGGTNRVWLNDTRRSDGSLGDPAAFSNTVSHDSDDTWVVKLADINRDGDLDVIYGNANVDNTIWNNNGDGTFAGPTTIASSSASPNDMAFGDLNGDGWIDFVLVPFVGDTQVWLNNGAGVFPSATTLAADAVSYSVALNDFDRDGDLDIVIGDTGTTSEVWVNNGSGSFSAGNDIITEANTFGVASADIDLNGTADVVTGNDKVVNRFHLGNGIAPPVFTDNGNPIGLLNTIDLYLADIDHDGDVDMLSASQGSQDSIWLNNGAGVFNNSGELLGSDAGVALAVGDLDNDGDRDVVVGAGGEPGAALTVSDNLILLNN